MSYRILKQTKEATSEYEKYVHARYLIYTYVLILRIIK